MLVCATCGSRWLDEAPLDHGEPVHADVARVLRAHLLGVGA
jgi:hypothetical protein